MIKLVDIYDGARIRDGALEFLYELMKEREPEINISHRELPTFEQHRQFVTRRPYRFWYLIEAVDFETRNPARDHPWIGYVSATHSNEIGIVLLKDWRGHGFGKLVVQELIALHRPNPAEPSVRTGTWIANVAPANERSRRMFEGLGFRKIQETFEFQSPQEEDHGHQEPSSR